MDKQKKKNLFLPRGEKKKKEAGDKVVVKTGLFFKNKYKNINIKH